MVLGGGQYANEESPLLPVSSSALHTQSDSETSTVKPHAVSAGNSYVEALKWCFVVSGLLIGLLGLWYSVQPPVQRLAGRSACPVRESFQSSAQKTIPVAFSKFSVEDRQSAELLYTTLGMYAFAYFPLSGIEMKYATWPFDKKKPGAQPPYETVWASTTDPVEVMLYYTSSLHIVIGDLTDAETGGNSAKISNLRALATNLQTATLNVLEGGITSGLSWEEYFTYPGPRGRKWDDGTLVDWAVPSRYKDLANALYTSTSNRHIDNQLWGKKTHPRSGDTTMEAFSRLIKYQAAESKKRYKNILALDSSGHRDWAQRKLLTQSEGIDTFHKFRKIVRTVGTTIETYPEVVSAFYEPIPDRVVSFLNQNLSAGIDTSMAMSYGDMFCFHGEYAFTASKEAQYCSGPIPSLATLLFTADRRFTPNFFGLSKANFNMLRAILLAKGTSLGHRVIFPNTRACPSRHRSFKVVMKGSTTNPFDTVNDGWTQPKFYSPDIINGTVCNLDDYFGNVHDLLVRIEQKSSVANENFEEYTVLTAQGLQHFAESVDIDGLFDSIVDGLCV